MRRIGGWIGFCLVLTLAVPGTSAPAIAASAKPGAACSKLGSTTTVAAGKLRCTLKSGKRVWARVSTARPNLTTPSVPPHLNKPAPAAQVDSRTAMLRAPLPVIDTSNGYTPADPILGPAIVEALFASVWSESPTTPSNVSIHIDPRVRAEWARDHTSTIGLAFSLNAKLGYSPSIRTDIYVGQDFAFLGPHLTYGWCAQIKGDSDPLFGGGGECGDGVIFGRTAYWSNFAGGEVYPYPDRAFDLWLNGNLPHEIAHNAQVQAARNFNNSDYWRTYPAWLREGWAEIVKVAVWGRSKGLTYREAREVYFGVIKQRCAPMAISDFHVPASTASRCEYDYGMLATEYLLASLRNIQAPFAMQQRSHAANFPDAFREAYAFDLAEFTAKADAYVAAQYAMHAPVTPR